MAGWGAQCLVPLLVCQTWALRESKICIFLRCTYMTRFGGVSRTRLNGSINTPYPEGTIDTCGFPVGDCLAARLAVSWPRLPNVA